MDLWVMIGIVVFVMIGQAALWSWVLIERQRKIPDVKILNWDELVVEARKIADNYYKAMGRQ
ncbi:hypothetical protein EKD04_000980 [Chloroflexales bacterium ZM16-3]|nr:hypothetical protein [Chloroflexales bacterium ZM16-3]